MDSESVVIVTIANVDPVVTLTGPSPVAEGSTHTYSYTTTDDGTPETFSLDTQTCDGGTLSAMTFNSVDGSGSFDCTYADGPSSHNPSVTVSDGDGGSDCDSVAVTVTNVAPSIAISGAANVDEGSLYTPDPGRGHRPGRRHGHELHRALGRRQHRHLRHERRQDPHIRRRRQRLRRSPSTWSTRTAPSPTRQTRTRCTSNNVAPTTPNLASPADNVDHR